MLPLSNSMTKVTIISALKKVGIAQALPVVIHTFVARLINFFTNRFTFFTVRGA
jgi:hypothetical protein